MTLLVSADDKISTSSSKIFRPWAGDVDETADNTKNKDSNNTETYIQKTYAKDVRVAIGTTEKESKVFRKRKHERQSQQIDRQLNISSLRTTNLQDTIPETCRPILSHTIPSELTHPIVSTHLPSAALSAVSTFQSSSLPGAIPHTPVPLMPDMMAPMSSTASMPDCFSELTRVELETLGLMCSSDYVRMKARKQRPKKYRCPHCQVAFSNNGQLKGHIRIHTGERPFKCDHSSCGKTFTRNEELTRHKRIHSGLRPFPCQLCGKRFGRKDHLKKHTRTHQKVSLLPVHVPMLPMHGFPYLYGF